MSWQDWMQVVATVAAGVAIVFAWRTVREARSLRRAARSDRILDCIAGYSDVLTRSLGATGDVNVAHASAARLRLMAALDAVKTPLPACRALINAGTVNLTSEPKVVTEHATDALEEVAALRGRVD